MKQPQNKLVDFFWSAQDWVLAPVLYLPTEEGGQGLVDIVAVVLLGEPLFNNPLLRVRILASVSVRACLLEAGIAVLAHLRSGSSWRTAGCSEGDGCSVSKTDGNRLGRGQEGVTWSLQGDTRNQFAS